MKRIYRFFLILFLSCSVFIGIDRVEASEINIDKVISFMEKITNEIGETNGTH